jgi:hypothetical protein
MEISGFAPFQTGRYNRGAPMSQRPGGAWGGLGTGWAITATMVAGIGVWGGLGYLADRLLDIRWLFFPIGVVLGAAGGIYLVYLRYGKGDGGQG